VLLLLALAVIPAVVLILGALNRRDATFFSTGKSLVEFLDTLAVALRQGDRPVVSAALAPEYQGKELGLGGGTLIETRDSVRKYFWASTDEGEGHDQAIDSWFTYLAGLSPIESLELHLERLEDWSGDGRIQALVRFEAIANPQSEPYAGIDRARFRMSLKHTPGGLQIVAASLLTGERIISDHPAFENVAAASGIEFTNAYYPRFLKDQAFGMMRYAGGGISAVDYNNDGFSDLFIPDGVASRLFKNNGDGTFTDVTAAAGLSGLDGVTTAAFADFDNDGFKDVFVSRMYSPNQLFRNNGDGTFTNVTKRSGIGADCCTTAALWFDYNNDGKPDLFLGRYLDARSTIPGNFLRATGEPNQLYRNNGDGSFTNVTMEAGVGADGLCLSATSADYDDDGYPDLLVAHNFGRATLYHNERDGTFADVTAKAGALVFGSGTSVSAADFDNDGRIDFLSSGVRSEHAWFAESPPGVKSLTQSAGLNKDEPAYYGVFRGLRVLQEMVRGNHLLRNRGDGTFEEVAIKAGATPLGWLWGAAFGDLDNDGWQDIYAADGLVYTDREPDYELDFLDDLATHPDDLQSGRLFDAARIGKRSWYGWERNRHLRANGDGTFSEIGRAAGTDLILNSRGVALADFWNRGVLDIAVSASAAKHALLKNGGSSGHWIEVELVGTQSTRDALGARVSIVVAGKRQVREVGSGSSYGSQSATRQHFGLDDKTRIEDLIVKWPRSGATQTFHNVPADRIIQITEGRDQIIEKKYQPPPPPAPVADPPLSSSAAPSSAP